MSKKANFPRCMRGCLTALGKAALSKEKSLKQAMMAFLVDIDYKSDGLIPAYEFTEHEFKKLAPGTRNRSHAR